MPAIRTEQSRAMRTTQDSAMSVNLWTSPGSHSLPITEQSRAEQSNPLLDRQQQRQPLPAPQSDHDILPHRRGGHREPSGGRAPGSWFILRDAFRHPRSRVEVNHRQPADHQAGDGHHGKVERGTGTSAQCYTSAGSVGFLVELALKSPEHHLRRRQSSQDHASQDHASQDHVPAVNGGQSEGWEP